MVKGGSVFNTMWDDNHQRQSVEPVNQHNLSGPNNNNKGSLILVCCTRQTLVAVHVLLLPYNHKNALKTTLFIY